MKTIKETAILIVTEYAQKVADDYQEPSRAGTRKGELIGLSRKKYYAAHLMPLYPKCLTLKEIAKKTGVSYGLLRIWRTEELFIVAVEVACEFIGKWLADFIEGLLVLDEIEPVETEETSGSPLLEKQSIVFRPQDGPELQLVQKLIQKIIKKPWMESFSQTVNKIPETAQKTADDTGQNVGMVDLEKANIAKELLSLIPTPVEPLAMVRTLMGILPCLHPTTIQPLLRLIKKASIDYSLDHIFLALLISAAFSFNENISFRDWLSQESVLKVYNGIIAQEIDNLTDPEMKELYTDEDKRESGKALQGFISSLLKEIAR